MQDETTDVATVDGDNERIDFANKAESLLRSILIALGYDNADKLAPIDLLTGIMAWVSMLRYVKLDAYGRYASIWWEAAKLLFATHHMSVVEERATEAMHAFIRMFPPTISPDEENERDTINDLAALSKELDVQTEIAAGLLSERDALHRANDHHASELSKVRTDLAQAESLVCKLSETFSAEKTRTDVFIERIEKALGVDTGTAIIETIESMRKLQADTQSRLEVAAKVAEAFGHAWADELHDNKRALVPLAKPERVEPGQRWAKTYRIDINANHEVFANGIMQPDIARDVAMLRGDNWIYLGTDKV